MAIEAFDADGKNLPSGVFTDQGGTFWFYLFPDKPQPNVGFGVGVVTYFKGIETIYCAVSSDWQPQLLESDPFDNGNKRFTAR